LSEDFKSINAYFDFLKEHLKQLSSVIVNSELTFDQRTNIEGILKGSIQFSDGSKLFVMEYIFIEKNKLISSTYRFHWQSIKEVLIKRWDNAPHHKEIKTFPYHLHDSNIIKESKPMTFLKVLEIILVEMKNII